MAMEQNPEQSCVNEWLGLQRKALIIFSGKNDAEQLQPLLQRCPSHLFFLHLIEVINPNFQLGQRKPWGVTEDTPVSLLGEG